MKKTKENKTKIKDSSENSGEPTAIINNDETTDNRFIQNNNIKNSIILDYNESYNSISVEEVFLLRYSDPVNTISLTDNYLLFGSMIGKVILYNIEKKHFYQLYDLANENIMGSSLENDINDKNVHYIAIGDESVVSIFEKENEKDIEANTIYNYENKEIHNTNCKDNFTLLWKNKALIIHLFTPIEPKEYLQEIEIKKNSYILMTYEIEDKIKNLTKEGFIEMSNYSVPFDFRENIFLFLEHLPEGKRSIGEYEFKDKSNDSNQPNNGNKKTVAVLDKNFGHISFLKILNKNMILMVRNYNIIEIYNIGNEFKMISSYDNTYEINDIDFYEIKNCENEKNDNEDNIVTAHIKFAQYNIIILDIEQNIIEFKYKNEANKFELMFKTNVKDINGIDNDLKLKGLFNLDFPDYIKTSPHYMALTTDQACFLFKKEKQ